MSDTYTVRRATMDDVKDIHALLMENARKGLAAAPGAPDLSVRPCP